MATGDKLVNLEVLKETVQKEVVDLKSALNSFMIGKIQFESGGWASDGVTKAVMVSRLRNINPIPRDLVKSLILPTGYSASGYTLDANLEKVSTLSYSQAHDISAMDSSVAFVNLSVRKDDAATSNISAYVDTVTNGTTVNWVAEEALNAVNNLASETLQFRGKIADLGYTSISSCDKTGFYTFVTSDVASITDIPPQIRTGGYIVTLRQTNSGAWQFVGNNTNMFVRSGLTAAWSPILDGDAKKSCKLAYNTASYSKSNARLRIYIPQTAGFLMIDMRHYYYDDSTGKADCWGIDNAFACDNNRTQLFQITNGGEWECVVRIKDGQDFSGGGTHGDEYNAVTTFFIDGMPVDITTYTSVTDFKELKIVQESELYTPTENGNQTKIATHGTEWIYTENGVRISQYLKWEPSVNIAIAYMCMFPVAKTSSYNNGTIKIVDRIFTDTGYDVYTPTNNTSKRWQGASVVDAYCTESKVHCKISPIEYVENLTGGNVVSETDNGGLNYFKLYWPVVNSGDYTVTGHTTESGELWKSVVEYSISLT